jgi:hypothetical protein
MDARAKSVSDCRLGAKSKAESVRSYVNLLKNSGDLGQHGMIACLLLLTLEQGIAYGLLLHLEPQDAVVLAERAKHSCKKCGG